MKQILIILITMIQTIAYGQWIEQDSGVLENLNRVTFTSASTGYIVGNNGTLLKSQDGGNNWESLSIPSSENFVSICYIDSETGFVGSETGFVFMTNDGGSTWETINLNLSTGIEIYFMNALVGFIGTENEIFRTINGGVDWIESEFVDVNDFNQIYEIEFVNDLLGYALNSLGILRSTDGGQTWIQLVDNSHPDYNGGNILTSMEIINEEVAHFGSPYYWGLYSTEDGGESLLFKEIHINDLDFFSEEIGFAIDSISHSNIIKTIDGGENWLHVFNEDQSNRLNDLFFVDENTGWAIGSAGKIYKTTTGGITTSVIDEEIDANLIQVYPNPAKDELIVKLSDDNNLEMKSIALYNNNGVKVYSIDIDRTEAKIQLSDLPSSTYFLNVFLENGESIVRKIILE